MSLVSGLCSHTRKCGGRVAPGEGPRAALEASHARKLGRGVSAKRITPLSGLSSLLNLVSCLCSHARKCGGVISKCPCERAETREQKQGWGQGRGGEGGSHRGKVLGPHSRLTTCCTHHGHHVSGSPPVALTDVTCQGAAVEQFKNNYFTEMCSGSEAGAYLRLIDFCITQL